MLMLLCAKFMLLHLVYFSIFYRNQPRFITDMTKNVVAYFFLDTVYS